jgi:hypothetical protein
VPTFAELGLPTLSYSAWSALFAPGGTPKDVIGKLKVKSSSCRCQGRRHQRPQLDQARQARLTVVAAQPSTAPGDRFRGKLPSPWTCFVFRP